MNGFVAVTDPSWHHYLSQTADSKDANFWRPSARAFNLPVGTPFLFKLKAPYRAIAGFGFFAGFTLLPDWLAWETFEQSNGVADLHELRTKLSRIRQGARIAGDPSGRIGCCLIAESRFFPESDWIQPPRDWSPRTQTGAKYDLATGEGRRIWLECLERSSSPRLTIADSATPRFGTPALYRPRLGQSIFRVQVLDAYQRACAVTKEHSLPVLEAAHIRPYAYGGAHEVANGLSLRTDLHRLVDRGYATIDAQNKFVVGRRLKDEFENGRSYYGFHGVELTLPSHPELRPSPVALEWHRENVFVG